MFVFLFNHFSVTYNCSCGFIVLFISRTVFFHLRMRQNAFSGRASPEPLEAYSAPQLDWRKA